MLTSPEIKLRRGADRQRPFSPAVTELMGILGTSWGRGWGVNEGRGAGSLQGVLTFRLMSFCWLLWPKERGQGPPQSVPAPDQAVSSSPTLPAGETQVCHHGGQSDQQVPGSVSVLPLMALSRGQARWPLWSLVSSSVGQRDRCTLWGQLVTVGKGGRASELSRAPAAGRLVSPGH